MKPVSVRRKVDEVKAVQVTADNMRELVEWAGEGSLRFLNNSWLVRVGKPEREYAKAGDWVIRLSTGQFTHLSDTQFKAQYEQPERGRV